YKALVDAEQAAFERNEPETWLNAFADDAWIDDQATPKALRGKSALRKHFADLAGVLALAKFYTDAVVEFPKYVIAESHGLAVVRPPLAVGHPGRAMLSMLQVSEVVDLKVVRRWTYRDAADLHRQLGRALPLVVTEAPH